VPGGFDQQPAGVPVPGLGDVLTRSPARTGISDGALSRFTSRHYWEVGATETRLVTGWLGRYLDLVGSPTNPLQGLSLDGAMSPTLATARNPVAAIQKPEDFRLWLEGVWGDIFDYTLDSASGLGDAERHSGDPAIAQVAEAAFEVGVVPRASRSDWKGAGGVSMLIGTRTTGTMVGEFPGVTRLDENGNLIENVDFRGVYASLLEQWFGHDAASVIPGSAASAASASAMPARPPVTPSRSQSRRGGCSSTPRSGRCTARGPPSPPAGSFVQLWNRGEDAHDLRIRRLGAHGQMVGRAQAVRTTQSGAISNATWKLRKGRYELYCSLFPHLQRGGTRTSPSSSGRAVPGRGRRSPRGGGKPIHRRGVAVKRQQKMASAAGGARRTPDDRRTSTVAAGGQVAARALQRRCAAIHPPLGWTSCLTDAGADACDNSSTCRSPAPAGHHQQQEEHTGSTNGTECSVLIRSCC
jgi:hypothetical protein